MAKHDLVHDDRSPEPSLIDVMGPFGRCRVTQRFAKMQGRAFADRGLQAAQFRFRLGRMPIPKV